MILNTIKTLGPKVLGSFACRALHIDTEIGKEIVSGITDAASDILTDDIPQTIYDSYSSTQEKKRVFTKLSEEFATDYMFDLENSKRRIVDVLYNDHYYKIDSDTTSITYLGNETSNVSSKAKDMYYVITYGNDIWTNVELTSETDTYDKLLDFISNRNNENAKYVNVVNGNINTNSDIINLYGIQSISTYKDRVYTVYKYIDREDFRQELYEDSGTTVSVEENIIIEQTSDDNIKVFNTPFEPIKTNLVEIEILEKLRAQYPGVEITEDVTGRRIVFEFESPKFNVYSSYIAEYEGEEVISNLANLLTNASKYENYLRIILPISVIGLLLIFIYLVISLGHKKGEKGIILNL